MSYAVGVDLGTTYTAAATYRDGRVEIASLGNRSASIPSVVLLREDEEVLTGEAANRRGATEPDRIGREFKRRVGDTTPIFLGGSPYSAEALMAKLLRWVTGEVAAREGGPADHLAVSHPANWGPYKKDLLEQAVRIADLPSAKFLTEPEAAAIHYASQSRVDPGEVVAVYDLGGGTFDAAILRKTAEGFDILGEPEGIERLGGIDFDAAVFAHVARSLEGKLEELDEDDAASLAAVARLRQESIEAKEALSSDTDATIPVLLPNVQTDVRITRTEFESMIRPSLTDSIDAMRRALGSAQIEPGDVSAVLLVGGSSRIPLVSQLVGAELGQPVAVDTHPKHAIALGAALAAAQAGGMKGASGTVAADAGDDEGAGPSAAAAGAIGAAAGAGVVAAASAADAPTEAAPVAEAAPAEPQPTEPVVAAPAEPTPPPGAAPPSAPGEGTPPPSEGDGKKPPMAAIIGGIVLLVLIAAAAVLLLSSGGDDEPSASSSETTEGPTETTEGPTETTAPAGPTITECTTGPCVSGVSLDGDTLVVAWDGSGVALSDDLGTPGGMHAHFYFPGQNRGTNDGDGSSQWVAVGPSSAPFTGRTLSEAQAAGASEICVIQANAGAHTFNDGTGNCISLSELG